MIDKKMPSRHFIVTKTREITTIEQANESTYTDDEVLLNALGYSVFEALKEKNIIFEGWSDKHIFEVAMNSKKVDSKPYKSYGRVHSCGVKHIVGIAKSLELANRAYYVISDSDSIASEKKKEYTENEQCSGPWFQYNDIVEGIYTLEDFIKHSAFKKPIECAREKYPQLPEFGYKTFETIKYKREEQIKLWIRSAFSDKAMFQTILKEIKNDLYANLTASQIEDSYFDFLAELCKKLD